MDDLPLLMPSHTSLERLFQCCRDAPSLAGHGADVQYAALDRGTFCVTYPDDEHVYIGRSPDVDIDIIPEEDWRLLPWPRAGMASYFIEFHGTDIALRTLELFSHFPATIFVSNRHGVISSLPDFLRRAREPGGAVVFDEDK
jgi:hypothetical protein